MSFHIEADRVVIREWLPSDEASLRALATDPVVVRWVSDGEAWSDARIEEFLRRQRRHIAERGFCFGAMAVKASAEVIGLAGLQPMGTTADVEVGWWLKPTYWGRGFATEAGRAALDAAFMRFELPRVVAIAHPDNRPSIRVIERLGLAFERHATGRELGLAAPDVDLVLYAMRNPIRGRGRPPGTEPDPLRSPRSA
jgi:ribosomal-protein-alanine N-acetyltransferase